MATENIYIVLDLFLDPAKTDFIELQDEVREKRKKLNPRFPEHKLKLQVADDFLSNSAKYDLRSQSEEAFWIQKERCKKEIADASLDGALTDEEFEPILDNYVGKKDPQTEVRKGKYFLESTVRSWLIFPIFEKDKPYPISPKEPKFPNGVTPTSESNMDAIAKCMKTITGDAEKDLYTYLGYDRDDRDYHKLIEIKEEADKRYARARQHPDKTDEVNNALIEMLRIARQIFKDDESKAGYDIALLYHHPFKRIKESRLAGRIFFNGIGAKDYNLSVLDVLEEFPSERMESIREGLSTEVAHWLVYSYYKGRTPSITPELNNDEAVFQARANAQHAHDEADRIIAESRTEADEKIKSAHEAADRRVADAEAKVDDATKKRIEAQEKQRDAETNAANALNIARKEFEGDRASVNANAQKRIDANNQETEAKIESAYEDMGRQIAEAVARATEAIEDASRRILATESNANEQIVAARTEVKQTKENADRQIAAANSDVNAAKENALQRIEAARKDAQDRIDANNRETEEKIKSARDEADQRVTEANTKQTQAEKNAAKAKFLARKEVKTKRVAAVAARKKAEADQKVAQTMKDEAHDETSRARVSAADALQKQTAAENTAMLKIAEATESHRWQKVAEKNQWRAIFYSTIGGATTLAVALVICFYGLHSAGVAHSATAMANKKLSDLAATLDTRITEANERADNRVAEADKRIAAAEVAQDKAIEDQRIAQADRRTTQDAHAKALEEQQVANERWKEATKLAAVAERDKNIAIEKERIAVATEARAATKEQKANATLAEAEQVMRDAVAKEIMAERQVAAADERAKMERERRMGVEAMIQAGVPMQFPLEDHERNEAARDQRGVQTVPVSSAATPLPGYGNPVNPLPRTVTEILREIVWRWCLEKELGIEDESGNLVGEVTEKQRTGYRASLQGSPLNDPKSISLYEPGYVPSLFSSSLHRRFMLSQTEVTQELWISVMGNNPSRFKDTNRPVENVSWEDVQEFITKLNGIKEELGVPSGYEFTLPNEAEWELACRAAPTNAFREKLNPRTMTPFHFGMSLDHKQANIGNPIGGSIIVGLYPTNIPGGTNVVGKYPANLWGLQDMHGNVREWCQDATGYGPLSVAREYYGDGGDPIKEGRTPNIVDNFYSTSKNVREDFYRSLRGGSWSLSADQSRSDFRIGGNPTRKHDDVGFRLCLVAAQ